jgi:hypothetical protein
MTAFLVSAAPLAAKDFSTKFLLPKRSFFFLGAALIGWGVSWDVSIKTCINGTRDLKRYSPHVQYKISGLQEAGVKTPTGATDLSP